VLPGASLLLSWPLSRSPSRSWSLSFLRERALAESKAELMGTRMPEEPGREPGRGPEGVKDAWEEEAERAARLRRGAFGALEVAAAWAWVWAWA
jgi:hypothetical protein